MDFYTRAWRIYTEKNYYDYLHKKMHYLYRYSYYKSAKEIEEELKRDNTIIYNEELVKKQFDKYYQTKKEYCNSESKLKEMFGKYEQVTLLSYEEELKQYKTRITKYAKKLEEEMPKVLERAKLLIDNLHNEEKVITLNDKVAAEIAEVELKRIPSLDDIDYRLIALNLCMCKYEFIYANLTITNEVNGFLTGYAKYLEQREDKYDYEQIERILFHDGFIQKISFTIEDYITNAIIIFTDGYGNNCKYTFKIFNLKLISGSLDNLIDYEYVVDCKYGNYEDYDYYLKLDDFEISAEKIEVVIGNEDDVLAKYKFDSDEYLNNLHSLEYYIDKRVIKKIEKSSGFFQIESSNYDKDKLTLNFDKNFSLLLDSPSLKYYQDGKEIPKEEFLILDKCYGERREEKYNDYLETLHKIYGEDIENKRSSLPKRFLDIRIDKVNDQFELGIFDFKDEELGTVEVIITCNNIKYIEE